MSAAAPLAFIGDDVPELRLSDIHPSPENEKLYRPVDPDDPDVQALARSIRDRGVLVPLVVSEDCFILSGHRRHVAARLAGLDRVPVRAVEDCCYYDTDPDEWVRLLKTFNEQRVKTLDEVAREHVVAVEPEVAYQALIEHREQKSSMVDSSDLTAVRLGEAKGRSPITRAKWPMFNAIIRVLNERREFWPLSDRQIHYALLNNPPLKHASKPDSTYANDKHSYNNLTNLLTRGRLAGSIPWACIADETRPVVVWDVHCQPGAFLHRELKDFLRGYYRDLQQSQLCHVEIVVEKLTVKSILQPIAGDFCIPLTVGRGYSSIPPRHAMAQRFERSGREKLVVLLVTDFDPDGEAIASSFARSMRDDFGVASVEAFKVALTAEQVDQFQLPPRMKAKAGSSTREAFVKRNGENVFELEALSPKDLQHLLTEAIDVVLDTKTFNAELDAEKLDAVWLDEKRQRVMALMKEAGR